MSYYYDYPPTCVVHKVLCKGLLARGRDSNKVVEVYKYIKIEKGEDDE